MSPYLITPPEKCLEGTRPVWLKSPSPSRALALLMNLALLLFYPVAVIGNIMIIRRYLNHEPTFEITKKENKIYIPIKLVKEALTEAEEYGAENLSFKIPES